MIKLFERQGLTVVGVDSFAPDLLAAPGDMGRQKFPGALAEDLALAKKFLADVSAYDCGQAVVVSGRRRIIAMEAAEGTDAMLARVADLRANGRWRAKGRAGLLVKAPKRGQDLRVDLPAIGPETLAGAAKAFLRGVAVAAGGVLMLDRESLAAQADSGGAVPARLCGVPHEIFHRHRRTLGRRARRKASGRASRARPPGRVSGSWRRGHGRAGVSSACSRCRMSR